MGVVRASGEVVFFGKAMAMRKRPDAKRLKQYLATGDQQVAYVVFDEGAAAERAKEMVLTPVRDDQGKANGFFSSAWMRPLPTSGPSCARSKRRARKAAPDW
jgi:hypothetical protein